MTAGRRLFAAIVAGMAAAVIAIQLVAMRAPAVNAAPMATTDTHTVLTPSALSRSPGVTLSTTAAVTTGHKIANEGRMFVYLANGYTDTITVTFQTPGLVDGLAIADLLVPVYSGTTRLVGPFPVDLYNQSAAESLNKVYVDYSGVTSVTVAAFSLPLK